MGFVKPHLTDVQKVRYVYTLLIYGEHNHAGVILINMNTGKEAALYDVGWISYNDKYI